MGKSNFYNELYARNFPIISVEEQQKIKKLRVGVAGCGSTGGAVVEGFLRLGIENFHLCDNGNYELNNLNRQMVFRKDIGKNKAEIHKERILGVNPGSKVKIWTAGVTEGNVDEFVTDIDFLFDAVDVTTKRGMDMKLHLHEKAFEKKIPVGSALDFGFLQW